MKTCTLMAALLVPGSDLRAVLLDGETEEGKVRGILDSGLILGRPSNHGLREITIPYDQILEMEASPRQDNVGEADGHIIPTISLQGPWQKRISQQLAIFNHEHGGVPAGGYRETGSDIMKRRVMLMILWSLYLGGCATQRVVQMGPRVAAADSTFLAESLRVGMDVKVFLVDGTVQEGQVRAFLGEGLVVGKPGNFGWQEVVCPYDQIQRVEMPPAAGGAATVAGNIFAGMLMGVMLLLAAVSISLRNSGGGCN